MRKRITHKHTDKIKDSKSNRNSKIYNSYHHGESFSIHHDDDDFRMKSSLQIDQEYKAITKKFNLF